MNDCVTIPINLTSEGFQNRLTHFYGGFIQANDTPASIVTFDFTNKNKSSNKTIEVKKERATPNRINF